jgi:hypothetical protein
LLNDCPTILKSNPSGDCGNTWAIPSHLST